MVTYVMSRLHSWRMQKQFDEEEKAKEEAEGASGAKRRSALLALPTKKRKNILKAIAKKGEADAEEVEVEAAAGASGKEKTKRLGPAGPLQRIPSPTRTGTGAWACMAPRPIELLAYFSKVLNGGPIPTGWKDELWRLVCLTVRSLCTAPVPGPSSFGPMSLS